ncbi:hypothetical protein SERLA73DRAFT_117204 [Serpula lacrymans var. lacrymans S7.3]|uniref:Histone deacetylase interacting domain-containing protein n=1 Tax=Serpula lacrymans var. lacrymans (strain S7.3) TaxID=936435 RepID=F8QGR3_SERL3|nr:hypothetical protein SERLA73DRAFT_117204 [Serpula lacrymans var. lacrymans S7.3]
MVPPRPQSSSTRLPPVSYIEAQVQNTPLDRPLNVTDALSYLDAVKMQFHDQPDVYNHFLDIMKDFKSELIDTPGVIKRVSYLFNGHPALIQGFNTFLPVGYRIECSTDPQDANYITVTTPSGTMMQSTNDGPGKGNLLWSTFPSLPSNGITIEPAVQYVQKIKQRCDEATYRQFLEILGRYHNKSDAIDEREVSAEIAKLFKDAPDLRSDFRIFMPEKSQQLFDEIEESYSALPPGRHTRTNTPALDTRSSRRKYDPVPATSDGTGSALPQKRKRKVVDREKDRDVGTRASASNKVLHSEICLYLLYLLSNTRMQMARPSQPSFSQQHTRIPTPEPTNDEAHFFDRVKRALDNRETFNEFLKLINLFTQGYIDTARLVRESRSFLGEGELMRQFREIVGWDDRRERERWLLEEQQHQQGYLRPPTRSISAPLRPGRVHTSLQVGLYRKLPDHEANVSCTGRDEMCKSVLNDYWVSHPTWTSEDSGFIAHKKNIYEEALHRSEEERHEYDFHIEAIVRTISMLEPINNKIATLSPEDRPNFKLKPNLGGSGKSIHQRVIKKIYGREAGAEVIQSMQDSPAVAIPVVLMRLKQKEEEWKRAQREWNKVWREVDARNYHKSLDHQAITFKASDKKAITTKALVSQIEAARDEHMAKRASFIDPLFSRTRPRHQLEFVVDDFNTLQDVLKLTFSFLDRTQGQIALPERKKIEGFLRTFVPLFFSLDPETFNRTFTVAQETADSDMSDDLASIADDTEVSSVASGSSRAASRGNRKTGNGGDLRKKLLKSEQAKSTSRKARGQDASPSTSRPASPAIADMMQVDCADGSQREAMLKKLPKKSVFFSNTIFYVLLRLLEILYDRLHFFKGLENSIAQRPSPSAGMQDASDQHSMQLHFYDLMLDACERLFDSEVELHVFEDQMRIMFGVKDAFRLFTIDKVIGAFIKQVQLALADSRSQELYELLKRDRALVSPSTQDQLNSRRFTENVLGPDENIFRIDWLCDSKTVTVQLIGKDSANMDDSEALTERWQSYVDSFVSSGDTEGLSHSRMKRPFLRKNLPSTADRAPPDVIAQGALEIRVCVRTYRLFYVSHTEDFLQRSTTVQEMAMAIKRLETRKLQQKKRLEQIEMGDASLLNVIP